mmetsp:Transcript_29415/g.62453  ORF Transcript_29415/g.62453 Transcript_29415/m.62453 type:complete len:110 (-) Transcript_29415:158-487(-)|eukprot:CAMPEP_0172311652 /NCGR_PEP_ID=MMETSP1058-20130122/15408_1 /TAXON_ID=83371 /ORGANISM="Detonula confervacea, Strain CCMP 353" /LENGTH=109 /DNA_ID=CAMNT_0013024915 /DNA_START=65 /DNA_END=394 /DNA_ORIENTATION=+
MAPQERNLQRRTSAADSSLGDNVKNEDKHRAKLQDPFLFYSNPTNLRRALNFESIDFNAEDSSANVQVVRKTRISFEKDPLTLMMEDIEFRTELEESLGGAIDITSMIS